MTTPRRTRVEFEMAARVARAQQRGRLVVIASDEAPTLPVPRPHSPAEVVVLRRRRRSTHLALRYARLFALVVLVLFYLVPTGAALGWWGP